jgi:spore maturation protein CgeB
MGYLGTYSPDRQAALDELMCVSARRWPSGRFAVAGPLYPPELSWPANIERIEHVGPERHRWFYSRQRFTLNITRADMIRMGYSPSVRLFEAAACNIPIITDYWPGLETIFVPDRHILIARSADDVLVYLREYPERKRSQLAARAREHVLAHHTAAHRAVALEECVEELFGTAPCRLAAAG